MHLKIPSNPKHKRTMNSPQSIKRPTGLAALCLCAVLLGCNDSSRTSTEPTPVSARTTNATAAEVDNTRINVRDRDDTTLTPGDQGTTPYDRDVTIQIRKALVSATNDYSVAAKNVKIITANGKVTLRGPVKTEGEKTGIANLAKSIAGAGNVDDQLEVKSNP